MSVMLSLRRRLLLAPSAHMQAVSKLQYKHSLTHSSTRFVTRLGNAQRPAPAHLPTDHDVLNTKLACPGSDVQTTVCPYTVPFVTQPSAREEKATNLAAG